MSEIAKCPLCGDEPDVLVDLFDKQGKYPKGYACCEAEFATVERWNKYAAAMDYAKKTAYWFGLPNGIHNQDNARAEKAMQQAETRVLEVFK